MIRHMIRQQFEVVNGLWTCPGCKAVFVSGQVEHPAGCPQMKPVECKHLMVIEGCAECRPRPAGAASGETGDGPQNWNDMHYVAEQGRQQNRFGPWFIAQYSQLCTSCGVNRWEPGDRIRADNDEGDFVCETCGSKEDV